MTVFAQLIAKYTDIAEYTTYVFQDLNEINNSEKRYIMCVRYPNWEHRKIDLGEIGFLTYMEVIAGVSTWYNGSRMIPYKYNNIQFMKFIEKPKDDGKEFIM